MTQDELDNVLLSAINTPAIWNNFKHLFDKYVSPENLKVEYIRSQLLFGGPFQYQTGEFLENGEPVYERYLSLNDRLDDQYALVTAYQVKVSNAIEWNNKNYYPTIKRHTYSMVLHRWRFDEVINADMAWAIFAVLFVFAYLWFHLHSLWLGFAGMLVILLSFPVTQIIYCGIFRITMYSALNQLVIFIVLGIAADNIFVFCDAWRQSENIPVMQGNNQRRMAYTFRRARDAIAVTSSTTSVAFLANAFSPIVPI